MAVIVAETATSLSTAGGFYTAEAYNVSPFSTTQLSLSSTRTIAVTFANSGNNRGIILDLANIGTTSGMKSVTVELQENVLGVWTTRASKTLTGDEICNNSANQQLGHVITPFIFGTPYAVTTAGSTWRYQITNATGTTNWTIGTSDGTNPFYIAWNDNTATASSTNDLLVCAAPVTVDMSFTTKGYLGTGDTTNGVGIIICKSTTPTPANVANLVWENAPASSYTLKIDGACLMGAYSGFRAGTSASPIPIAQMATIEFIQHTVGTLDLGWCDPQKGQSTTQYSRRASLLLFGEVPTYQYTTLSANASTGQANIVTTDTTGWSIGDTVFVGKQDVQGQGDTALRTISAISGTSITLSSNLATATRKSGGHVIRLNGYGIYVKASSTSTISHSIRACSNFTVSGCQIEKMSFGPNFSTGNSTLDDSANISPYLVQDCSAYSASSSAGVFVIADIAQGSTVNRVYAVLASAYSHAGGSLYQSVFTDTVSLSSPHSSIYVSTLGYVDGNVVENCSGIGTMQGAAFTLTNNDFWGFNNSSRCLQFSNIFNPTSIGGNTYNKSFYGITFIGNIIGYVDIGSSFGNETANSSSDINIFADGLFIDAEFNTATPNPVLGSAPGTLSGMVIGSNIKFSDYNSTANDDRGNLKYGTFQRTGYGLSDTTVRTSGSTFGAASAGKFAFRFRSTSGSNPLTWLQKVPTGDITGQTMTVSVWCKINSANYYAGTYQLPRLIINYDNGTVAYAEATATTAGQRLSYSFTPTTSYGQITVTLSTQSDASSSDTDVYWDNMSIQYPSGYVLPDMGAFDNWANALPITPSIATLPGVGQVWDELIADHATSGTFGEQAIRTDVVVSDNQALILTK